MASIIDQLGLQDSHILQETEGKVAKFKASLGVQESYHPSA